MTSMNGSDIEKFLITIGYKLWKSENTGNFKKNFFQIRFDNKVGWDDNNPVCNLNHKVLINVDSLYYSTSNSEHQRYEVSLVAENTCGNWCDLKIYSLTADQIFANLHTYEDQLIRMWRQFNN